jgi:predicted CoA-binding protein
MAVYVDDMEAKYGRFVMCHMLADSTEELLAMARAIGVDTKWIQKAGTHQEHFDIAKSKRALAVQNGAIEIDRQGLAAILRKRRGLPPQ